MGKFRTDVPGTIYVLHFDPPFKHAMHYIGWTEGAVEDRLASHLAGTGARLVRAAVLAGCEVRVALTLPGTRADERRLKNIGNARRTCPECRPQWLAEHTARQRARRATVAGY